ncbi:MAG: protein kinase domain-containing protein [Planctomycetota bacterium]
MPDPDHDWLEPLVKEWLQSDDPDGTLERLCAANPEHAAALRARLGGPAPTAAPRASAPAPARAADRAPTEVGPYRVLDTLGEGGMGSVYLVEQREPVRRKVALKLIKLGMDSVEIVRRFEQERQALAMMDHEGIAKVFDCGTTERGQPYFVMELVKGVPLDAFCANNRLPLSARVELVRQVCAAVQHAHQKGVVHRDLKPGNVLVSSDHGRLQVKIIDFGLAKAMGGKLTEATLHTETGQVMGTPEYMAPEQADPSNEDIDTRVDVYSLGVMLYVLLVGALPFPAQELRKGGLGEMQRVLREVDPPRPSKQLTSLGARTALHAQQLRISVGALRRELRGDLDWVLVKALEKDRNRRYGSAAALADDLKRYLEHEPLEAGPPSAAYRLQKLARRYRLQLAAGALVFVASLAFGSIAFVQWRSATTLALSERAAKEEARTNLARFEAKSAELGAKVDEFDQLAGVVRCEEVVARASALQERAAWPAALPAMTAWLDECDALLGMRADLDRTLASLRADGRRGAAGAGGEAATWTFVDRAQGFLHRALTELTLRLDELASVQRARVEQRIRWATRVEGLTRAHPGATVTWAAVRRDVLASTRYQGRDVPLSDEDVGRRWLGLVPLGPNPVTGLQEFYHLRSAWDGSSDPGQLEIPTRRADGSIERSGDLGVVFVLLPGGRVQLGAQRADPRAPHYDAELGPFSELHEVELAPFLLARHELTQGQWARMWTGAPARTRPSFYAPGGNTPGVTITDAHPVEQVDYDSCVDLLQAQGLTLPTEAQWEYGCLGGTTSQWIVAKERLFQFANLADQTAQQAGAPWTCEPWSDGHVVHAPVGSFLPNAYGLFDVHGNVWEWCLDAASAYGSERPGDGLRSEDPRGYRIYRGGSFDFPALNARSAYRSDSSPSVQSGNLGLRAARSLQG